MIETKALQAKKTVALARWLLGKHLVRRFPDGREEARMIVETEAYDGERDLACHARAGRTKRTEVMDAAGGIWYVYLWNRIDLPIPLPHAATDEDLL